MTITVTASGISLDGPLVAGEKVAVSVSGLSLAAEDKPTLALLARFPDALLASVELAESETAGTWTGELDTATKQTALFFATARADERRDAALELVAGRVSLARLTVPMANSALCPKPDGSPFASPVYIPVPGPPGTGGDPYDQAPEMDGEASAGSADEYARGDHRHPTPLKAFQVAVTGDVLTVTAPISKPVGGRNVVMVGKLPTVPRMEIALSNKQDTISDLATIRSGAAAGATAVQPSALAAVATTGDYGDLTNKPTIPAAQIQSDWNQTDAAAVDFIKNKPTIPGPAPSPSTATPQMDGAGAAGSATTYARGDHRHPTDTSREAVANKVTSFSSPTDTQYPSAKLVSDQLALKAPLDSPAFTGTPTAPTANAGTNTTQVATTAFVQTEARYALTAKTPTVSGTAATVACEDRAINDFTVATGITSLTITPPAAVTGRARDFFCRVTLTDSSLPTVTLSGATIDIGATEVAGMTQCVNLLMFTEIASGHWLASRRSAS